MMLFEYKAASKNDVHYQPFLWSHDMVDKHWTFPKITKIAQQFSATRRSMPKDINLK